MKTTENSSIFRLLTKELMLLTSATFLIEKKVVKKIPPYFKNQSVPIVSYSYTNSIGRKILNYKEALQESKIPKIFEVAYR
jgi:hypothetical protein